MFLCTHFNPNKIPILKVRCFRKQHKKKLNILFAIFKRNHFIDIDVGPSFFLLLLFSSFLYFFFFCFSVCLWLVFHLSAACLVHPILYCRCVSSSYIGFHVFYEWADPLRRKKKKSLKIKKPNSSKVLNWKNGKLFGFFYHFAWPPTQAQSILMENFLSIQLSTLCI